MQHGPQQRDYHEGDEQLEHPREPRDDAEIQPHPARPSVAVRLIAAENGEQQQTEEERREREREAQEREEQHAREAVAAQRGRNHGQRQCGRPTDGTRDGIVKHRAHDEHAEQREKRSPAPARDGARGTDERDARQARREIAGRRRERAPQRPQQETDDVEEGVQQSHRTGAGSRRIADVVGPPQLETHCGGRGQALVTSSSTTCRPFHWA